MNSTEVKLQYNICEGEKNGVAVVIVAAGSSSRMKGTNKLFLPILGVPVIARTLMAFENCSAISKIVLVTAKESVLDMQLICERYAITKLTDIVEGGSNRHESVINGIEKLSDDETKVLIHDGARPFVDGDTIMSVIAELNNFDASVCVHKINDTVKMVDENNNVISTVDRSMLYGAQTPQGIDIKKYLKACNSLQNPDSFTDDVSIMEAAGYSVKAVLGNSKNIKITTPDDLIIANSIAERE